MGEAKENDGPTVGTVDEPVIDPTLARVGFKHYDSTSFSP